MPKGDGTSTPLDPPPPIRQPGDGTTIARPRNPTGGTVIPPPPPDNREPSRPGGGAGSGVAKGTLVREDWEIERASGVWFRNGLLVFDAPNEGQSPTASLSRNLKGDFDLRVDYVITPTDDRKASGADFGIRLDSRATESQLSIDRKVDPEEGDKVVVNEAGGLKPLLSTKPIGLAGAIRVVRRGGRFRFAHGNANGSRWTEMGEVNAPLAEEIQLWMVGFTDWAGARVTVHKVDLTRVEG